LQYTKRRYSPWGAYAQAKLANVLFANELARRTAGTGVTSNSLHPGFVHTAFGGGQPSVIAKSVSLLSRFVGISAKKGAATSIMLASSPQIASLSGAYFSEGKRATPNRIALDSKIAERLWRVSADMTNMQEMSLPATAKDALHL
jgi:NAD(P)-dependent dehydrogenase (short-subunit alcohol dehydrogenase family)